MQDATIKQMLGKYPGGFSISYNGTVCKIIFVASHLASLATEHPIAPQNGGYLVVEMTADKGVEL